MAEEQLGPFCGLCGCAEDEHGAEDGICTGCDEECEYEPEEDEEYDD